MSVTLVKITDDQHASAIEWLIREFKTEFIGGAWVDTLTAQQAYREIQNWYPGGWAEFVHTCTFH